MSVHVHKSLSFHQHHGQLTPRTRALATARPAPTPLAGGGSPPPGVTFGEFAEVWLERQIRLAKAGLVSGNSIRRCESGLASYLLPFFGAVPLDEITRERLEAFRAVLFQSQTLAPLTINSVMGLLGGVLRRAIQDGVMTAPDPTRGIRPLSFRKRRVECYTPTQTRALLAAADGKYRAMIALAVLAGLRRGEILALAVGCVDLDAGVIRVERSLQIKNRLLTDAQRLGPPKSASGIREVPIRTQLREILTSQLHSYTRPNRYGLVFSRPSGGFFDPNDLRINGYWPAIKRAGLERIAFHDLRVTFITHCAEAGVPMPVIARWVGHATVRTTDYYVHATKNTERDALALLTTYDRIQP